MKQPHQYILTASTSQKKEKRNAFENWDAMERELGDAFRYTDLPEAVL
jgi:hypothetical protein